MDGTRETNAADRIQGTIKTFNADRRHGFIEREGENDVFVHVEAVENNQGDSLKAGIRVEYTLENGPKGPRAASVRVL